MEDSSKIPLILYSIYQSMKWIKKKQGRKSIFLGALFLAQARLIRLGEDVPWTRRFIKVGTDLARLGKTYSPGREMSAPSYQQL